MTSEGGQMGAWGCGNLENDDALDWLRTMVEGGGMDRVGAALGRAAEPVFLDAPDACTALAAAEVVAAAAERPHRLLPADVQVWLRSRGVAADASLRRAALRAVRNVRRNSELQELWEEFGPDGWYRELDDLEGRLA